MAYKWQISKKGILLGNIWQFAHNLTKIMANCHNIAKLLPKY